MNELAKISYDDFLDKIEAEMVNIGVSEFETYHLFTPGLYVRTIHVPAGSYITSKIHKTEHPFVLSEGIITIFTEQGGEETFHSPYMGVTKEGSRRFAKTETACIFSTFHVTDKTDLEEIEKEVVETRENKLLVNNLNLNECLGSL